MCVLHCHIDRIKVDGGIICNVKRTLNFVKIYVNQLLHKQPNNGIITQRVGFFGLMDYLTKDLIVTHRNVCGFFYCDFARI